MHGWHLSIIRAAPSTGPASASTACSAASSSSPTASSHGAVHLA